MDDIVKIKERRDKVENLRSLMAQRKVPIKQWNVDYFFKIIDEGIPGFLLYDRCYRLADKYLIAMVFMYFLRASLLPEEYTRFNFFVALHLAHDMEEDDEDTRAELLAWSSPSGIQDIWTPPYLTNQREELFKRLKFRAVVSRACCDRLMDIVRPEHSVWQRQRHPVHAGASPRNQSIREVCPNCIDDRSPDSS